MTCAAGTSGGPAVHRPARPTVIAGQKLAFRPFLVPFRAIFQVGYRRKN
jgi:hypothetical protein